MNTRIHLFWIICLSVLLAACSGGNSERDSASKVGHGMEAEPEPEKGPHRGRLLADGDFALELAIFETGVPPEFRVWVTEQNQPVKPDDVDLTVKLIRLGDRVDTIGFKPQDDFLRGDTVIYEPHSFVVSIEAVYNGTTHHWQLNIFGLEA